MMLSPCGPQVPCVYFVVSGLPSIPTTPTPWYVIVLPPPVQVLMPTFQMLSLVLQLPEPSLWTAQPLLQDLWTQV